MTPHISLLFIRFRFGSRTLARSFGAAASKAAAAISSNILPRHRCLLSFCPSPVMIREQHPEHLTCSRVPMTSATDHLHPCSICVTELMITTSSASAAEAAVQELSMLATRVVCPRRQRSTAASLHWQTFSAAHRLVLDDANCVKK